MKFVFLMAVVILLGIRDDPRRPAIDYHQHLLSPSAAALGIPAQHPYRTRSDCTVSRGPGYFGGGMTPGQALRAYEELPFSRREFQTIYGNLTPYMQWDRPAN
jgi:hypothetical protein